MVDYHKPSHHNFAYKSLCQVVDAQIKNPAQSKIVQHQSGSALHAPSPSKGIIAPSQIIKSAPELYHMDVAIILNHHMRAWKSI